MTPTPDGWERSVWANYKAERPEEAKIHEWFQAKPLRREVRDSLLAFYANGNLPTVDGHPSPCYPITANGQTRFIIKDNGMIFRVAASALRYSEPIGVALSGNIKQEIGTIKDSSRIALGNKLLFKLKEMDEEK